MSLLKYFNNLTGSEQKGKNNKDSVPTKRPKADGDREGAAKVYEKKRKRDFQEHWKKNRDWLSYDVDKNLMFCTLCIEGQEHINLNTDEDKRSGFIVGSNKFRLENIKKHETSRSHVKFFERKLAKSKPCTESKAAKCLYNLKQAEYDKLAIKFRNVHAVAKSHLSFRMYTTLCTLDKMKGIDIGTSYLHDKAAADFLSNIADATTNQVRQSLEKSRFCSFTCDGSTDFTGEDLENIYVRTCVNGKIEDSFLSIGSAASASSMDIHTFIIGVFKSMDIYSDMKAKLVGFCSDGASNMLGKKSGLATLLKSDWPHLLVTHCLAHRLELSFKDAVKTSAPKLYEKASTLLLGLYYLYRRSPKQKKALIQTFDMLDTTPVLPTRIGGTRWLPHYKRALDCFFKGYRALRLQLESSSHDNPKAEGLVKLARDGGIIIFLLSLKVIITILMKLSLFLQKTEISLADAHLRIHATISVLKQLNLEDDETISSVLSTESFSNEVVVFKGKKPSSGNQNLIDSLTTAMETRFPHSEIVDATSISCLKNWQNRTGYGDKEIEIIYDQFSGVLGDMSLVDLKSEWDLLKALVFKKYSDHLEEETVRWEVLHREMSGQGLENILKIMDLIHALPPTSVRNETTFSAMKLLKNKRRGRLSSMRLNQLMMVHLQSPGIEEFDPDQAIKRWMITPSGRKRRLQYSRPVASPGSPPQVEVVDLASSTPVTPTPVASPGSPPQVEVVDLASSTPVTPTPTPASHIQQYAQAAPITKMGDTDSDYSSADEDDNEYSEDHVFSLLMSFRQKK